MQDHISGWSTWEQSFSAKDALISPSELHGIAVGICTVAKAPTEDQWQVLTRRLKLPVSDTKSLQLLVEESEDIAHALAEDELDYLPILPDDEHSLQQRVKALAEWCDGVVFGFGIASGQLRKDEKELIEHLQLVAAVEFDIEDEDEDGEQSYQEVYEFVRLIPISLATGRQKINIGQTDVFLPDEPAKKPMSAVKQQASPIEVQHFDPSKLN